MYSKQLLQPPSDAQPRSHARRHTSWTCSAAVTADEIQLTYAVSAEYYHSELQATISS